MELHQIKKACPMQKTLQIRQKGLLLNGTEISPTIHRKRMRKKYKYGMRNHKIQQQIHPKNSKEH